MNYLGGLLAVLILYSCHQLISSQTASPLTDTTVADGNSTAAASELDNNIRFSIKLSPYKEFGDDIYVATNTNLSASVEFYDSKYLNKPVFYNWTTKSALVAAGWNLSSISFQFKNPAESNYLRLSVIHENEQHIKESGSDQIDLVVKAPVIISNPSGKFFLEHGELLNITLNFNGSGPFNYCYRFCYDGGILPCEFCFSLQTTDQNHIYITKYLHSVGNHTLYFKISNIMNEETKHYAIKINETVREQSLPIVPIASSIMAVLILICGVTLHLHFRKTAHAETADFDFIGPGQEEGDWEEELSFIQRVRYIFCGAELDEFHEQRHLLNNGFQQQQQR